MGTGAPRRAGFAPSIAGRSRCRDPTARRQLLERLQRVGVEAQRVELVPASARLAGLPGGSCRSRHPARHVSARWRYHHLRGVVDGCPYRDAGRGDDACAAGREPARFCVGLSESRATRHTMSSWRFGMLAMSRSWQACVPACERRRRLRRCSMRSASPDICRMPCSRCQVVGPRTLDGPLAFDPLPPSPRKHMILTRLLRRLLSREAVPREPYVRVAARAGDPAVIARLPPLTSPPMDRVFSFFSPMFWATRDPEKVKASASMIADVAADGHYFGDNLLTWGRNMSMLDDAAFRRRRGRATSRTMPDQCHPVASGTCSLAPHITACSLAAISSNAAPTRGVRMKTVDRLPRRARVSDALSGATICSSTMTRWLHHSMPEHGSGARMRRVRAEVRRLSAGQAAQGMIPDVFASGSRSRSPTFTST